MNDFRSWLNSRDLGHIADVLIENGVNFDVLSQISEEELKELGLNLGDRHRLKTVKDELEAIASPDGNSSSGVDLQTNAAENQDTHPTDNIPEPLNGTLDAVARIEPMTEPRSRNGSKTTALLVAIAVHVGIALVATLFVILPPSKDEPEIVAILAPAPVTAKQELKKKNVQKLVKRSSTSASAAAAPMAMMMKANAMASFTVPDVKRTSTGPLGMGEGDLGTGAFGIGTGLGDAGSGGSFLGVKTSGDLAVVFDITASMYVVVPNVVSEINRSFKNAQVLVVFSGGFEAKPKTKIVPYQSNKTVQGIVAFNAASWPKGFISKSKSMNKSLFKLQRCDSLESALALSKKPTLGPYLQSLGRGIELLIEQPKSPGTIIVFSDFADAFNPAFMKQIETRCKRKGVKVVFWYSLKGKVNARSNWIKSKPLYEKFAKSVGGKLKIGIPK